MTARLRHSIRALGFFAFAVAAWLLSTEPWGLGVFQLFVFTAPGALLGLGAAWMAHIGSKGSWSWYTARRGAVVGATTLPPLLAFLVALDGNARPQALLAGFVYSAWIALVGGAVAALFMRRSESEPRCHPAASGAPAEHAERIAIAPRQFTQVRRHDVRSR